MKATNLYYRPPAPRASSTSGSTWALSAPQKEPQKDNSPATVQVVYQLLKTIATFVTRPSQIQLHKKELPEHSTLNRYARPTFLITYPLWSTSGVHRENCDRVTSLLPPKTVQGINPVILSQPTKRWPVHLQPAGFPFPHIQVAVPATWDIHIRLCMLGTQLTLVKVTANFTDLITVSHQNLSDFSQGYPKTKPKGLQSYPVHRPLISILDYTSSYYK